MIDNPTPEKPARYRKRGRYGADDLKVIDGAFAGHRRPDPPNDLTKRQSEIWREITLSEPPDFFKTSALQAMLKDFVSHREAIEGLNEIIRSFKQEWIRNAEGAKRYKELLKMRADETRASSLVATRLRLTNQSRYTPQAAATASKNNAHGVRPWEET